MTLAATSRRSRRRGQTPTRFISPCLRPGRYTVLGRTVLDFCIYELVNNAIVPENGHPPIEILLDASHPELAGEIVIRDYGQGISWQQRRRSGTPFFSTKPGHAGLGIALCRLLLEEAGGRLTLYSQPGQGAIAVICLPPIEALRASLQE